MLILPLTLHSLSHSTFFSLHSFPLTTHSHTLSLSLLTYYPITLTVYCLSLFSYTSTHSFPSILLPSTFFALALTTLAISTLSYQRLNHLRQAFPSNHSLRKTLRPKKTRKCEPTPTVSRSRSAVLPWALVNALQWPQVSLLWSLPPLRHRVCTVKTLWPPQDGLMGHSLPIHLNHGLDQRP